MSLVADDSKKRKRAPKLNEDEKKIHDLIISTTDMGIWKGDFRYKLKLPDPVVNKAVKSLKDKGLIKEVTNHQNRGKKLLMSVDFDPSDDLTGGNWYDTEGKLDTELVTESKKQCLHFISRSKAATIGGITEFMNNNKCFNVKFTGRQIEEVVQGLILDKEIFEAQSTGKGEFARIPLGEQCFQRSTKKGLPKTGGLASIPCGVCPRMNECTPDGIISPSTCVYFAKWLDF